jgi:hypothetical protein
MKSLVRFAVAGAMLAGFATAQAQSLPITGSSDLWLFVADTSTGTTFAEDLGGTAAVNTLLPTSSLLPASTDFSSNTPATLSSSASLNIAASSALSTFLASTGSDNVEWAVEGAQYLSTTNKNAAKEAPGGIVVLASVPQVQGPQLAQDGFSQIQTIASSFNADLTYVNGSGIALKWSASGSPVVNVWGASLANGGSTNLYGQGPDQSGIGLGQSTSLFGITGNGGTGQLQTYDLGDTLTLSQNGTLTLTGSGTSPVPLPAAVWLFGSGLLGLLGVGRRRAA